MIRKALLGFYFILNALYLQAEFIRDNNKSVVIDTVRNLMWQDQVDTPIDSDDKKRVEGGNAWNFQNAQNYCRDLEYGGFHDWYVPSTDQLVTAVDEKYKLQPKAFKKSGDVSVKYWSSSIAPYRNTNGMCCELHYCELSEMDVIRNIRCVRDISKN